jgi:hypothetical protein
MQAELEVIRLKQAITFVEPPPDFTRIAVQRAREELVRDGAGGPSMVDAPAGFTANVMKQVFREAGREAHTRAPETPPRERVGGRAGRMFRHPVVFMPAAAAAALLLVWGLWFRTVRPDGLRLDAGEATARAPAAEGGAVTALRLGQVCPPGHEVRVAEGRSVLLQGEGGFAAIRSLEVQGPARLVLAAALPADPREVPHLALHEGGIRLASSGPVSVSTPIPAEIRLAAGVARAGEVSAPAEMDLSLREITRHDESLAGGRVFQALRISVLSGEAMVQRGAALPDRIASSEVAVLDPWSPIRKERALDPEWLASISLAHAARLAGGRSVSEDRVVQGKVVRSPDRAPVGEATVTLHLGATQHTTKTLHDGSFQIPAAGPQWEGVTPFLAVKAPAWSRASDLHYHAIPSPGTERLLPVGDVEVPGSRSARGRVATSGDRAVEGVRVRVFEYDEFFGRASELEDLAVLTARDGSFELPDLPGGQEPGTGLVLLLDHPGYPLATRFDLCEPARSGDLDLHLAPGRTVAVGTPEAAGTAFVVVDAPPGIARTWVSRLRECAVTAGGLVLVPGWTDSCRLLEARGQALIARTVRSVGAGAEARLELAPRGADALEGRVLSRGAPAASVPVVVGVGAEHRAETLTDENGRFDLTGSFGPGPVVLEVGEATSVVRVELRDGHRQSLEIVYEPGSGTPPVVPALPGLKYRPERTPDWTRHGPWFAAHERGAELRLAVVDGANARVDGVSLYFHAAGAGHAVFLGKSAPGLTIALPAHGRLVAVGEGGAFAHRVLAGGPGSLAPGDVSLTLHQPVRVEGRVNAPALADSVPPIVVTSTLAEGWLVEMARNPDRTGGFVLPHVPAGASVEVACGGALGSFLQDPGSTLKLSVSESQDGLRVARQP